MSAYNNISDDIAIPGMIAEGIQGHKNIRSRVAQGTIQFGDPAMGYVGDDVNCYPFALDVAKIVFDADFEASNSCVITVDGDAWDAVVYATSHDNTMDLLIAEGTAQGYEVALDATDTDNRTIYIKKSTVGSAVGTVTEAVTGGSGQPDGTITYQTDQVFLGCAVYIAKDVVSSNTATYSQYDEVCVGERGIYWMYSTGTISADDDVYLSTAGLITATAGLTIACKSRSDNVTTTTNSDAITKVEVNGIYKPYSDIAWV